MVHSAEGTRALALELCREFEDKFLLHIAGGEVSPRIKTTVASLWRYGLCHTDMWMFNFWSLKSETTLLECIHFL